MAEISPGLTPPPPASSVQAKSDDNGLGKVIIMSVAGVLAATLLTIGAVSIWGPGTTDITTLTQIIFAAIAPAVAGLLGVLVVLTTRAIALSKAVEEKVDVMGANVDGKLSDWFKAGAQSAADQATLAAYVKSDIQAKKDAQVAIELAKENEAARTKALEQTAIDVAAARAEIPPGGVPVVEQPTEGGTVEATIPIPDPSDPSTAVATIPIATATVKVKATEEGKGEK